MDAKQEDAQRRPPVDSSEYDIDELIAEGSNLINSIYRELNLSSALRAVTSAITSAPTTSTSTTSSRPVGIRRSSRRVGNFDEQIEQIHRYCDSIDSNLRSIGLVPIHNISAQTDNGSGGSISINSNNDNNSNSNSSSSSSNSSSACNSYNDNSRIVTTINISSTPQQHSYHRVTGESPETIDLSDYQDTFNYPANDDVLVVSVNTLGENSIIDLCTPPGNQNRQAGRRLRSRGTSQQSTTSTADILIKDDPTASKVRRMNTSNEDTSGEDGSYKCPICLESVRSRLPTSTKCGHVFCSACIQQVLRENRKCPMCKAKLQPRSLFRIYL